MINLVFVVEIWIITFVDLLYKFLLNA